MKLPVFFAGSRLRVATETPHRFPGWAWDREMQGEGQEAACSSTLPRLLEIRAAARLSEWSSPSGRGREQTRWQLLSPSGWDSGSRFPQKTMSKNVS